MEAPFEITKEELIQKFGSAFLLNYGDEEIDQLIILACDDVWDALLTIPNTMDWNKRKENNTISTYAQIAMKKAAIEQAYFYLKNNESKSRADGFTIQDCSLCANAYHILLSSGCLYSGF